MAIYKDTGLLAVAITATFYLSFFSGFVTSSIPGYFFAIISVLLSKNSFKYTLRQYFVMFAAFVYFALLVTISDSLIVALQDIRYWFGIIIFIIFFKQISRFDFFTTRLFRIVCYLVILEYFVLIFFGVGQNDFKSYSVELSQYRPLGITSNASMSSALLSILFLLLEIKNNKRMIWLDTLLLTITILVFQSGVGIIIFLFVILYRMNFNSSLFKLNFNNMAIISTILIGLIVMLQIDQSQYQKFSLVYYYQVFGNKAAQLFNAVEFNNLFSLIGTVINDNVPVTSGDIGWLLLLQTMGIVGFILYFFIVMVFYNSHNKYKPILILLLIATSHYPVLMTQTGQLIGAYILVFVPNYPKRNTLNS